MSTHPGNLRPTRAGTWEASLPKAIGARERQGYTFKARQDALDWLVRGDGARRSGQPLPVPSPELLSQKRRAGTEFAKVAADWHREVYLEDFRADAVRAEAVKAGIRRIDTFFKRHDLHLETFSRQNERDLYRWLLDGDPTPCAELPDGVHPDDLVTRAEALAIPGMASLSTFKTRLREDDIRPAVTAPVQKFRIADLYDPAARLVTARRGATPTEGETRGPLKRSTARNTRWVLLAVLEHARQSGIQVPPNVGNAKLPGKPGIKKKERVVAASLQDCARVAGHLHVVHQLALWLMRTLGLRISEAFGIHLTDITDHGPGKPGVLRIWKQGGRAFKFTNAEGQVVVADSKDQLKNLRSVRLVVVPPSLMDLIRLVIRVFHVDENGLERDGARLIPGLKARDKSGAGSFRRQLALAAKAEGIRCSADKDEIEGKFRLPTPHYLRKSLVTDLEVGKVKKSHIQSAIGHRPSAALVHTTYTLEDRSLKKLRKISQLMQQSIISDLGTLQVPTTQRCTTGNHPALAQDAARIDALLLDAGWLILPEVDGEATFTTAEVAEALGRTEQTVAGRIRAGELPAVRYQGGYLIRESDFLAELERVAGQVSLKDLAAEVLRDYDVVRHYIRRAGLALEEFTARDAHAPVDTAENVRLYFKEQDALLQRATRLSTLAKEIGVSVAMLDTRIRKGLLVEDPVREHGGLRMVTNESAEATRTFFARVRRR
ncbi:helix-turn-helix domain-containing protein [Nocardioides guangzhouensis]|uniref:Helix-turn-helix domain-containing protein n=1 Tax=Nocardioides guangzhouensis TaxID=2497878 RepID=A0A4Q4Z8U5_9ACTN|nr:helix-turn-helix domain-containing protein [Nocardioides guangzhouensis]RYP84243.1 helix-turn-helix domain-containing protein [Nocardioides guangzhouensis]